MTDRERVARALHSHRFPAMPWDRLPYVAQLTYLVEADAALAAMPTWRRIPDEVREGEAPFRRRDAAGKPIEYLLRGRYPNGHLTDVVHGWWSEDFGIWSRWQHSFPPTHYAPIPPLPAPPAGEVG